MPESPIDPSLFESAYSDSPPPKRGARMAWIGVGVVVAIAVVVFAATRSTDEASEEATATLADAGDASPTSTGATSSIALVPYLPDPQFLHHPTVLPRNWDLCRLLDDATQGDRFCSKADPDAWIQVTTRGDPYLQGRLDVAPPTGDDHGGVWFSQGEVNEVVYQVESWYLSVMNKSGLPPEALVEIATSIPFIGDRDRLYGAYEVPIDLTVIPTEELAALLIEFGSEPSVQVWEGGGMQVSTPIAQLFCYPGYDGLTLPWASMNVPLPRLVPASRPLVVGSTVNGDRGYALWDQRGHGCRIEGQMSGEHAAEAARTLMERLDSLAEGSA